MGLFNQFILMAKKVFGQPQKAVHPSPTKTKAPKLRTSKPQNPVQPLATPPKKKKRKTPSQKTVPTPSPTPKTKNKTPPPAPHSYEPKPLGDWQLPPLVPVAEATEETVYFQNLPLDLRLQKAILDDLKFKTCSPIQGLALPLTLQGKDLCGRAQTGTGKTATFLITIMQRLLTEPTQRRPNQPYALILAPTRELAMQIDKDAQKLCPYTTIKHHVVFGGTDYQKQQRELASGCDILAATPGRLIDYFRHGIVDLSQVSILVIDEADRMLDMGFIPDVKRIIQQLPTANRQTLFFSATLTPEVLRLAQNWLKDPVQIETGDDDHLIAETINEIVFSISEAEKISWLKRFLTEGHYERVIIFCNRKREVENVYQQLQRSGFKIERLSGDVDQKKRFRILERFRSGEITILVATDVAGRGIHINGISHVINYDLPYEAENYVHRIGRTGRAGQPGTAISLACESGCFMIADIEKYIKRPLPFTDSEQWWNEQH